MLLARLHHKEDPSGRARDFPVAHDDSSCARLFQAFATRRESSQISSERSPSDSLVSCVASCSAPYASGGSQIEQGISKAGNKRARTLLW